MVYWQYKIDLIQNEFNKIVELEILSQKVEVETVEKFCVTNYKLVKEAPKGTGGSQVRSKFVVGSSWFVVYEVVAELDNCVMLCCVIF